MEEMTPTAKIYASTTKEGLGAVKWLPIFYIDNSANPSSELRDAEHEISSRTIDPHVEMSPG